MTLDQLLADLDSQPEWQAAIDQASASIRDDFDANGLSVLNRDHVKAVLLGVVLTDTMLQSSPKGSVALAISLMRFL